MDARKQLPMELEQKLTSLQDSASDAAFTEEALACLLEAWEVMPAPQHQWDYHPESLCLQALDLCLEQGDVESGLRWISLARVAYDDPAAKNPTVNFYEGQLLFEANRLDEAFVRFDELYKLYKKRPFAGSDPKYLAFYLQRLR